MEKTKRRVSYSETEIMKNDFIRKFNREFTCPASFNLSRDYDLLQSIKKNNWGIIQFNKGGTESRGGIK